jgi:hypothetical protein
LVVGSLMPVILAPPLAAAVLATPFQVALALVIPFQAGRVLATPFLAALALVIPFPVALVLAKVAPALPQG